MRKYVFINYQSTPTESRQPHESRRATEADYADLMRRERRLRSRTNMRRALCAFAGTAAAVALFFIFRPAAQVVETASNRLDQRYSEWVALDNTEGSTTVFNTLPDGSRVFLAAGSILKMSPDFNAGSRAVALAGAAHFDIARNEDVPFTITSPDNNVITVLGTEFFVNTAYKGTMTNIALERGSVSLTMGNGPHKGKSFEMSPGDMTIINGQDALLSNIPADFYEKCDFTREWLDFHDAECSDVIDRVEEYYGVDFNVYCHNILSHTLTADFNGLTIREILELLKYSLKIDYTYDGTEAVLF